MKKHTLSKWILFLSIFAIASCSGSAPEFKYYVMAATGESRPVSNHSFKLMIAPIGMNDKVDISRMILDIRNSEMIYAKNTEWAGSIKQNIQVVIADHLTNAFPKSFIAAYRDPYLGDYEYELILNFRHFNAVQGNRFLAQIQWRIIDRESRGILSDGTFNRYEEPESHQPQAIVKVSEKILAEFSSELINAMKTKFEATD